MVGDDERTPREGETLILDGTRRFVISSIDTALRGWWFEARAEDGSSRILSNTHLKWDTAVNAWRPEDDPPDQQSPARRQHVRSRRRREGVEGRNGP
jgi:hypothetical protein